MNNYKFEYKKDADFKDNQKKIIGEPLEYI
jgi:hypothetical protein